MSGSANLDNPQTRGLARYIATVAYDDIPGQVKTRLKLLMLDALGCAIYGVDLPWSRHPGPGAESRRPPHRCFPLNCLH